MITVEGFHFTKDDFAGLAKQERALIFLAGHTLNQIGVWVRLLRFATNHAQDGSLEERISGAQSQVVLRALCGVLVEAWEWLKRPESNLLVGRTYLPLLPEESQAAYAELKKHFGGSGLLHQLRNRFLYHYPTTDDIDAAFANAPAEEDWAWYVSDEHTNSIYLSCELVVGRGTMRLADAADHQAGLSRIAGEAVRVANGMTEFLTGLLAVAVQTNFPASPPRSVALRIEDAPDAGQFVLPFFAEGL